MAEMEYKAGVKIDTSESQVTIKQLKKQVQELTTLMDNLTAGTREYDETVTELVKVQTQLETAMKAGKSQLSAQEGSYNALSNEMAALKKVMKATTDEAKRMQLSDKINEINDVLKEMDKAQGVHSRNVGNYEESIVNAYQRIRKEVKEYQAAVLSAEEGTEEWEDAMNKLSKAQFELRDMNEKSRYAVADFGEQLANVNGIASGLMSGFSALQGAMVLCGVETADFEQTMMKLQSAMAIVQGLQGLEGLQDRVTGLMQSIKLASKAMGKGGWIGIIIAVVAAISALTVHLVKKNKEIKNGTAALREYNKAANENVGAAAEQIVKIQLLDRISRDAAEADEIRNRAAKELLETIGESITDTNILAVKNGEYADTIKNKVIPALIAQARMEGALDLIKAKQKEILEQQVKVNERIAEAPTGWDKVQAGLVQGAMAAETNAPVVEVDAEDFKEEGVERQKKKLQQMEADFTVFVDNLFKDFSSKEILVGLGIEVDTENPEKEIKEKVMSVQEALEFAQKQIIDSIDEDIASIDAEIDIEISDDYIKDIDEKNKRLKKSAEYQIKLAEDTARREIEMLNLKAEQDKLNAKKEITDKEKLAQKLKEIEDKRAVDEANINLKTAEKKKEILDNWAEYNTDAATLILEIQQALADNEVEIAKRKFEQLKALQEEHNNNTKQKAEQQGEGFIKKFQLFDKAWEDMDWQGRMQAVSMVSSQVLASTSDILGSIADMYEQNGVESEKEAKKIKNLRIAGATIDMLNGAVMAFAQAQSLGVPLGPIMGGINAAAVLTMGALNIAKIKNTDVSGSSSSTPSVGASVIPKPSTYSSDMPATFTRQLTGASEIEELNKEQRVVLVESDMMNAINRVQIRQSESSF